MDKLSLHKFKWFWAWQDDKEENWLQQMSLQGWHLASIDGPCFYTFLRGKPCNFNYRLDYRTVSKKDIPDYLQLYQDAGWEHLGELLGWQYFRIQVETGESAEIFSDAASKIQKYRRLLGYLVIMLPIIIISINRSTDIDYFPWLWTAFKVLLFILLMLYLFAFVAIMRRISQLKKLQ